MEPNERQCRGDAVMVTACERYLCEPCTRNWGRQFPIETHGGEPACHGCGETVTKAHFRPLVLDEVAVG
jgi:hypothetical protein